VAVVALPGGSRGDQTVNFVDIVVLEDYLEEHGIRARRSTVLTAVRDGAVTVREADGGESELPADAVVVAATLRPRAEVAARFAGLVDEVHVIGDCKAPRILFDAIHEGFETAIEL
jgi:pyruvate/2-oxoglutarate dehydrogenase complex dihydrolipoamide dehydrogenase (E3) component